MYSYNDFERLFLRYKLEGIPAGVSIEKFCMSSQVPYNLFSKWYKDIRRKIVPVQVLGAPSTESEMPESPSLIFACRTSNPGGYPHEQWCSY